MGLKEGFVILPQPYWYILCNKFSLKQTLLRSFCYSCTQIQQGFTLLFYYKIRTAVKNIIHNQFLFDTHVM